MRSSASRAPTRLWPLALLAAWGAWAPLARAQPWIVLPVSAEALSPEDEQLAEAIEGRLAERRHTIVAAPTSSLGSDAHPLSPDLIRRLSDAVEPALEHAAFGRRSRVIEAVSPLLDEVSRSLDALGRNPSVVRNVSDLALVAARSHLDGRDEPSARAAVERLLALTPHPDPTVDSHPHAVLALLARAQTRLREMAGDGRLHITSADPGGCNVYLNGQLVGPAPQELSLYTGDYAVRVQCGETLSRTHLAHVESGAVEVQISPALESALQRAPRAYLRYPNLATMEGRAGHDAATLMQRAAAERAVLIYLTPGSARLDIVRRVGAESRTIHTARLATPAQHAELETAWRALFDASPAATTASEWNIAVGVALIAAGLGALISPINALVHLGECVGPIPCREVIGFGPISTALTTIGLAAIAGGVIFWAVSPIRASVAVAPDGSASLTLEGTF